MFCGLLGSAAMFQLGKDKLNPSMYRLANGSTIVKAGHIVNMQQYEDFEEEDAGMGIAETYANYRPTKRK